VIPTDEKLDAMRLVCDPVVDEVITRYFASASREDVGALMHTLFRQGVLSATHPLVAAYTAALDGRPEAPIGPTVARGQRLFELYGPEILLTLGSYAVPLAYAAANGVQVIYRARRLKDDPIRRLCDTAQMVINVMQAGELARGGIGWRSIRKVRLIHAVIRHLVAKDHEEKDEQGQVTSSPWQAAWGRPINQEDQAGTLLTFSIGAIHGLRLMGAQISKDDGDDYLSAWAAVGRLLGVEESLLPVDELEGAELAKKIGARQHAATPEGQMLMGHLLRAVDSLFPFRGYALSLSHFFLGTTVYGEKVVEILRLPKPNWTRFLVGARAHQKRFVLRLLQWVPGARRRRRFVARNFTQAMLLWKRPDAQAPFEVPPGLLERWRIRRRARALLLPAGSEVKTDGASQPPAPGAGP
jgi:hypothetical protein